jgi:hypothetical protein
VRARAAKDDRLLVLVREIVVIFEYFLIYLCNNDVIKRMTAPVVAPPPLTPKPGKVKVYKALFNYSAQNVSKPTIPIMCNSFSAG